MNLRGRSCPPLERIEEYATGQLVDPAIDRHVLECGACADYVENARFGLHFADVMRSAESHATTMANPHRPIGDAPPKLTGYDVVREVAHGGHGVVYEAVQISTRRRVALKVVRPEFGTSTKHLARFEREVEIASQLDHAGIVRVHDSLRLPDGRHALVMEFVEGEPIGRTSDGVARATLITRIADVCDAVHFAHQRGVIHRDLKPSNILIDRSGRPRVLDFGVASRLAPGDSRLRITGTGEFSGTLAYAAPEQVSNTAAGPDLRSDVYALGVVLYESCFGRLPYEVDGSLEMVLRNVTLTPPAEPAKEFRVDHDLWTIVSKALSKDTERRYQSAASFGADLRRYLAGGAIDARRDSRWYVFRKSVVRHKYVALAVLTMLTAIAVVGAVLIVSNRTLAEERQRLAEALRVSTIEQARALAASGRRAEAEALLWPEILQSSDSFDPLRCAFSGAPKDREALWAYFELQAPQACLASFDAGVDIVALRARVDRATGIGRDGRRFVWSLPTLAPLAVGPPAAELGAGATVFRGVAALDADTAVLQIGDELRCVSLSSGALLGSMPCDNRSTASLSNDGMSVAVITPDLNAAVYGLPKFELQCELPGHDHPRWPAWIDRLDESVALLGPSGELRSYSLSTGNRIASRVTPPDEFQRRFRMPYMKSARLMFSPSGDRVLLTAGELAMLIQTDGGALIRTHRTTIAGVQTVAFSHTGRLIVTFSPDDSCVRVWNGETFDEGAVLPGHERGCLNAACSPDDRYLVTADRRGAVRVWATPNSTWRADLPDSAQNPHDMEMVAPDRIVAACSDGAIREWSQRGDSAPTTIATSLHAAFSVSYAPASEDRAGLLAVGGDGDSVPVFASTATGHALDRSLALPERSEVRSLRFSPNGAFLAVATQASSLHLWRTSDWTLVIQRSLDAGRTGAVRWSPDGRFFCVTTGDGSCHVFDVSKLECVERIAAHAGELRTLAFSHDGRLLATGGDDHVVRLWEVGTWKLIRECPVSADSVFCLAFHPLDQMLAVGDRTGLVTLIGVTEGRGLGAFAAGLPVMALDFCSDGKRLLVARLGGAMQIWDLEGLAQTVTGNRSFWERRAAKAIALLQSARK